MQQYERYYAGHPVRVGASYYLDTGPTIQWVQSYVTDDKIYCVYIAPDESTVRTHAARGRFPAGAIARVCSVIDPTTAEQRRLPSRTNRKRLHGKDNSHAESNHLDRRVEQPGIGRAAVRNRSGCRGAEDLRAESRGVREPLRQGIQGLHALHLSYLQHAVRHLRPLRTMNGGLAPPCAGGRAQSRPPPNAEDNRSA
jgi:Nickel responsive protein SCO4226-like